MEPLRADDMRGTVSFVVPLAVELRWAAAASVGPLSCLPRRTSRLSTMAVADPFPPKCWARIPSFRLLF